MLILGILGSDERIFSKLGNVGLELAGRVGNVLYFILISPKKNLNEEVYDLRAWQQRVT
jgi:hypothetical protein